MQKTNQVLLLTGGHAAAVAGAVVTEIQRREKDWEIHWVGAKFAMEGKSIHTFEYKILPELGVTFHNLFTGRVQKRFTFWTIPSLLRIPFGFVHAFYLLRALKPKLVVSFGGFASFPIVVCSWLLRIPVLMHEQTIVAGQANIFAQAFVKRIMLSRWESTKYLDAKKAILVGNPVSRKTEEGKQKLTKSSPPIVFVTGGSRGSSSINNTIQAILPRLLVNYAVIHQTGEYEYEKFKKVAENLPSGLAARYTVFGLVGSDQWSNHLNAADIVVSRAGAPTVSALIVAKKPSILIPLPHAYKDEQMQNALFAREFGISEVIPESELKPELLLKRIKEIDGNWKVITQRVSEKKSPDVGAVERVVDIIEEEMN